MSSGSLSFAKLVMMLSVPAKSTGDIHPKINSFNQRCPSRLPYNLDSNLIRSAYLKHNITNVDLQRFLPVLTSELVGYSIPR